MNKTKKRLSGLQLISQPEIIQKPSNMNTGKDSYCFVYCLVNNIFPAIRSLLTKIKINNIFYETASRDFYFG